MFKKRGYLKQVGKIGKINAKANTKIAQMWVDLGIEYCEVCPILHELGKLQKSCLQASSNAHRHKRMWYRGDPELLWDYNQVVRACANAHAMMEADSRLTKQVFDMLRDE